MVLASFSAALAGVEAGLARLRRRALLDSLQAGRDVADVRLALEAVGLQSSPDLEIVTGCRGGVDIRAILRGGSIVTGYPTNLPRNP